MFDWLGTRKPKAPAEPAAPEVPAEPMALQVPTMPPAPTMPPVAFVPLPTATIPASSVPSASPVPVPGTVVEVRWPPAMLTAMVPDVLRRAASATRFRIAAIEGPVTFVTPQTPWLRVKVVGWYARVYEGRIQLRGLKQPGGVGLLRDREDGIRDICGIDWEIASGFHPILPSPSNMAVLVEARTPFAEFEVGVLTLPLHDTGFDSTSAYGGIADPGAVQARRDVALADFTVQYGWRCGVAAVVRIPGPRIPDRSWLSKPRSA